MKFLFVCTGNTCRSPMAEGIAKSLFEDIEFKSAGLYVNENDEVSKNSVLALNEFGIDISSHTPTPLTIDMVKEYDYIIPMTTSHKNHLLMLGVNDEKILSFKDEIKDPFGGSLEIYKQCAKQIKENIDITIGELNDSNS